MATQEGPQEAELLRLKGNALFQAKDYNESLQAFSDGLILLKSEGGSSSELQQILLSNRSLVYYRLGKWEEALADARACLQQGHAHRVSAKAAYRAACSCVMLGRYEESKAFIQFGGQEIADLLLGKRLPAIDAEPSSNPNGEACSHHLAELLSRLEADLLGDEDAEETNPGSILSAIEACIRQHPAGLVLEDRRAPNLLLPYLSAYPEAVRAVFRNAILNNGDEQVVLWSGPFLLRLSKLGTQACISTGDATTWGVDNKPSVATECLQLLRWAAHRDPWLISQVTQVPLQEHHSPAETLPASLLRLMCEAGGQQKSDAVVIDSEWLCSACEILTTLCEAVPQAIVDAAKGIHPLQALMDLFRELPDLQLRRCVAKTESNSTFPDSELEALEQLRQKRAAIYDPQIIACRHALLGLLEGMVQIDLVLAKEMVNNKLPTALVKLVRALHEKSPQKMVSVVSANGGTVYEKRRFTADYLDNPAGDFLVRLDLPGTEKVETTKATLLHRSLDVLATSAETSIIAAKRLVRRCDVITLLQELAVYADVETRMASARVCSVLCAKLETVDEVLETKEPLLLAAALSTADSQTRDAVCWHLLDSLSQTSVDQFSDVVAAPFIWVALQQHLASQLPEPWRSLAKHVLVHRGGPVARCWRKGSPWDGVDPNLQTALLDLLKDENKSGNADQFQALPRGFLGAAPSSRAVVEGSAPGDGKSPSNSSRPQLIEVAVGYNSTPEEVPRVHAERSLEEIQEEETDQVVDAAGTPPAREAAETSDEEELVEVYDSSKSHPASVRQARAVWLGLPMEKRLSWTQSSTDVSVFLTVPAGTHASEIAVKTTGPELCVHLRWYGRLFDEELWESCKATEMHWCLEGSELHVLLPKRTPGWWKAVTKGGAERSYHELLHEAVNADEPVAAYDDLTDEAKDLIDSIQERQAYIAAGMLDPEGFDDFRVVIGENSLKG